MEDFIDLQNDINTTRQLIRCLDNINTEELRKIFQELDAGDILNEFNKKLDNFDRKYEIIKEKMERKSFKLYFFGKLSSGKSTIINGLIGQDLFEHSTYDFVHIGKSENVEYKINYKTTEELFDDSKTAKEEINKLFRKNKEIDKYIENSIKVFVPIDENNNILQDNIELIDTPGSGNKEQITKCITEYAKDADLFVYVLMHDITEEDEKFFQYQLEHFSLPDIFILINKWNDNDYRQPKTIKQMENDLLNKCDQLILKMSKNCARNLRDRIYFISANEVFDIRINKNKEYLSDEKKKRRYENFKTFEYNLSEYINNQINCGYQRFSQQILSIKKELHNESQMLCTKISNSINSNYAKTINENKEKLEIHKNKIREKCKRTENKCIKNIKCEVTKMVNTLHINKSDEISKRVKDHYTNIDEDIKELYTDLDEILSVIKDIHVTDNTDRNDIKFTSFGNENVEIKTDMQFVINSKSKIAVRFLSFLPFVGGGATNILLTEMEKADDLKNENLHQLNKEIHADDDNKNEIIIKIIKEIEEYFVGEINKIIEKIDSKGKFLEYLEKISKLNPY